MNSSSTKARVVVTGMGVVSPIGVGTQAFWESALAGVNGLREIQRFDTSELRAHKGGEVLDFEATDFMSSAEVETMGRASHLAVAASRMALEQAGLDEKARSRFAPHRLAVSMGTTMGEPEVLLDLSKGIAEKGLAGFPHDLLFRVPSSRISNNVGRLFGFKGVNYQIPTACAAGNYAIGYGADLLRLGRADLVLAGGSDAFSQIAFVGFNKLLAVATDCVRPFDKNRGGMMIAEGAACLVLERLEDALDRGATIYGEFLDYGLGCDAHKMTIPHPEGRGGVIAMRAAITRAGVSVEDVDLVCAHGTGTKENDKVETGIIKEVLGAHAYEAQVNSIKSMIGHTMGAASAIEAVACIQTVREDRIPPTINYAEPDPECDLSYVPNTARACTVNVAVSNAYAFGGNCSSIVVRKYHGQGA
ncbi:MAG: beta-ketoacyl-[acyl-carrier-protein] synthase family protein [Deltaproteobacteria bacterium]|nr:beta-ketoacyl-[acyl-carrier-protein] synthase family protein [Deltaproteobacteria bacterium]